MSQSTGNSSHTQWRPGFLVCSGQGMKLLRFGFYELDYYKTLFSDWFMEIYCTLEIAHKLLVATATLKIVKLQFCAFYLVT